MQTAPQVNILLVDDHPENLIALEAMLEGLGQNLVKAHSGEEALRCLLNQDFAVILLDVQMPGMDGFETATLIRQRQRSRNTPIIFLTAFSTNDNMVFKGYVLGAVDYLFKPIDPVILTSKVTVFVELFQKTIEVQRQAAELAAKNTELRQSEQRFRSLSACSPIGIFLTDTAGKLTYSNPNFQAICGCIEETWEAQSVKCIHAEDRDRVLANWSVFHRTQQNYAEEFRIYASDGSLRWVQVRTSPLISEQRELLGHVGTIEDITERKQAEAVREEMIREQAARAEAEAANQMKDEFLAIVSHELRTPLNSMLGWSKMLLTRNFDEATRTKALETIQRNAQSQAQLIEDILDVSKIIRGKLRLVIRPVNLNELIKTVVDTVRPQVDSKKIQLEIMLASTAVTVSADTERLRQIIWNLLTNAIKFTPEEGCIEVKLSVVGNGETANNATYAQIEVIDTGIGIPTDFLPYVFDRFRQADSSPTRPYGGLGLGLTIVRHLLELHGGKISVCSEGEGKGATFTVRLPLHGDDSSKKNSKHTLNNGNEQKHLPSLANVQVLVVEDNDDAREYIQIVLQQSGAKVTAVASADEAMVYLQQATPHVLVSDIAMPEEDGYQLIRKIRDFEVQRGGRIPAIALTAYAGQEDQIQALSAGFQMHVPKPVEPNELVTVVAQLVGQVKMQEVNNYQ